MSYLKKVAKGASKVAAPVTKAVAPVTKAVAPVTKAVSNIASPKAISAITPPSGGPLGSLFQGWDGSNNAAILGGLLGAGAAGPLGAVGGALLGDMIGGNKAGLLSQLQLPQLGGGQRAKATYGHQIPMPELDKYKGIESLANRGMLQARQLTGADITREMEQSPWYKMALQKQAAEEAQRMNLGASQSQTAAAQAMAGLASRGGLRGGAAERLGQQAGENLMMTRQNILGQGAVERSGLGMHGADIASRLGQFNIGQQSQTDVRNLQTQLADLQAQEERKKFEYGEGMKMKGAGMTAQAMENAGKK